MVHESNATNDMFATDIIDLSQLRLKLPKAKPQGSSARKVATTAEVDDMLSRNACVAIGISGGKDGLAAALATAAHLDRIGHTGPRVLIHADLGRVEWKDSLPACQRLAAHMGWDLLVVKRAAGDMLSRWQTRWEANVRRYADLECVKLILPWSTPSMRFCTSELKTAVICRELRKRYPTHEILNVTGIRRQESAKRAKAPVSKRMEQLCKKGHLGLAWNSVIEWPLEDVLQEIADAGLELHEAYTTYGTTRVSCVYCIMSSEDDLKAASTCTDNQAVYVNMVELEVESGFAFQGARWLGDVAPHLLPQRLREGLVAAKAKAQRRVELESALPEHLHYVEGWPIAMPTAEEATLIAQVRRDVALAMGLEVGYTTGESVLERYAQLMALKAVKEAAKAKKKKGKKARQEVAAGANSEDQAPQMALSF